MTTKICSRCQQEKPLDRFSPCDSGKYNVHSKCKVCRSKNKEKALIYEEYLVNNSNKEKVCQSCNVLKTLPEFTKDKQKKDGHCNTCKECKKNKVSIDFSHLTELNCLSCSEILPIENFRTSRGGYSQYCDDCRTKKKNEKKKQRKLQFIELKGRYCQICGYDGFKNPAAMDFHHLEPTAKDFSISNATIDEDIVAELNKCVILCANCHRGVHSGIFAV